MSELSPATQTVLDAVDALYKDDIPHDYCIIATALRAAADQGEIFFDAYDSPVQVVTVEDLLAIATELEAQ